MNRSRLRLFPGAKEPEPPQPSLQDVASNFDPYRLKQAIHLAMLDEAEAADSLNLTVQYVKWLLCDAGKPKPEHVQKMADLFGYPPKFFMAGRPKPLLDSQNVSVCMNKETND